MIKFLFVVESISVASGGPARVAAAVGSGLVERGHSVVIASMRTNGEKVPTHDAIKLVDLGDVGLSPISWMKSGREIKLLADLADVVVVSGIWGPIDGFGLRFSGLNYRKVFIRTCGMFEAFILRSSPLKKKLARFVYVDRNLESAAGLLPNTEIEANNLRGHGIKNDLRIIPNGVRLPDVDSVDLISSFRLMGIEFDPSKKYLLYLGRIHPKKGLDIFMPAFERYLEESDDWILVVAGSFSDEEYKRKIDDLVRPLRTGSVVFVGEVAGPNKEAAFRIASAFILPSHSEGFPNAVVEALSWGIPAIITPGCNFPELTMFGAGLESDLDSESLLVALRELLSNGDRLAECSEATRPLVRKMYSLESVLDAYEKLAESVSPV